MLDPLLRFSTGCNLNLVDACRHPVLLVGEPGLQKRSIAALVHYASIRQHNHPVVGLDANTMSRDCGALLGRGGNPGLLSWLGDGTLVLSNTQQVREQKLKSILLARDCRALLAWWATGGCCLGLGTACSSLPTSPTPSRCGSGGLKPTSGQRV